MTSIRARMPALLGLPLWLRRLPLIAIIVLLVALVLVPVSVWRRTESLRTRVTDVIVPTRNTLLEAQLAFASEVAAVRGFELTGDSVFLQQFRADLERDRVASARLTDLGNQLGPRVQAAVVEFLSAQRAWREEPLKLLQGRVTRDRLIETLPSGQRRLEAALLAADRVNTAVIRAETETRSRIRFEERVAWYLVALLSLGALAVALLVVWLSRRLDDLARQLRDRVAEEEALRERERQARDEAEAAVRHRDQILRVVSHDLKNPLHTIDMVAQLLLDLPLSEEKRTEQLQIIRRTVLRMDRLVRDLLDATRLQSGRTITVMPRPVDTAQIFNEVLEPFRIQAHDKNQRVECDIADGPLIVLADHDRLIQVLSNLIGNAVKFTPEGGRIQLRAAADGEDTAAFLVADTGPGISPEVLPRLFEPFWQAQDSAALGTGLGLAIARGIVEAHGGRISVESTPGKGCVFIFTLPRAHTPSTP